MILYFKNITKKMCRKVTNMCSGAFFTLKMEGQVKCTELCDTVLN